MHVTTYSVMDPRFAWLSVTRTVYRAGENRLYTGFGSVSNCQYKRQTPSKIVFLGDEEITFSRHYARGCAVFPRLGDPDETQQTIVVRGDPSQRATDAISE